jgi:hypothetical protein
MNEPEFAAIPDDLPRPAQVVGVTLTFVAYAVAGIFGLIEGIRRRSVAS